MRIFQGEPDRGVPTSQASTLAKALPGSHLRLFPDAGHRLILGKWSEILGDLHIGYRTLACAGNETLNDDHVV